MKVVSGISVDPEVLAKAKILARKHHRSFSNYIEWLIMEDQKRIDQNHHHHHHDITNNTKDRLKRKKSKK